MGYGVYAGSLCALPQMQSVVLQTAFPGSTPSAPIVHASPMPPPSHLLTSSTSKPGPREHNARAPVQATHPPSKRSSAIGKKGQEHQAPIEAFRSMLVSLLRGQDGSSLKIATAAGFPREHRSLRRYAAQIRANPALQCCDASATLQAQVAAAASIEYKSKAVENWEARRLFSEDELLFFERYLITMAEMGWPMDFAGLQRMFSVASKESGRIDWKSGDAYVVSKSYVRKFVYSRPSLKAYKASNIDPLRAKKATLSVPLANHMRTHAELGTHVASAARTINLSHDLSPLEIGR